MKLNFIEIIAIFGFSISLAFGFLALITGINDITQDKKLSFLEERLKAIDDLLALLNASDEGEVSDVD